MVKAHGHGGLAHGQAATSNTAEYMALIEDLDALRDTGVCEQPVTVIGDAMSVIDQMQQVSAVLSAGRRPLYQRPAHFRPIYPDPMGLDAARKQPRRRCVHPPGDSPDPPG
jgi:ribonuclease HI